MTYLFVQRMTVHAKKSNNFLHIHNPLYYTETKTQGNKRIKQNKIKQQNKKQKKKQKKTRALTQKDNSKNTVATTSRDSFWLVNKLKYTNSR